MTATLPRARDLGIPLIGEPGTHNAITDVAGVTVGQTTLISGDGRLTRGEGPVRTGVTVVLPRGPSRDPVFAGWWALNGCGEMTGTTWIAEAGFLETPIAITNTHSVGAVHEAVVRWQVETGIPDAGTLPFTLAAVAETYDGRLNDIDGFHVRTEHVFEALRGAHGGPVAEGNVGGGTGMICHGVKGGTGTASRVLSIEDKPYTLGVLVQANYGAFEDLTIAGVPVGRILPPPETAPTAGNPGDGSIIVIIATDAPLLPHQLERLCRRAAIGIGRVGGIASNGSGDIVLAFSTANPGAARQHGLADLTMLPNDLMNPLFRGVAEATEESILNAICAAETMTGADGHTVRALDHDAVVAALQSHGRLSA